MVNIRHIAIQLAELKKEMNDSFIYFNDILQDGNSYAEKIGQFKMSCEYQEKKFNRKYQIIMNLLTEMMGYNKRRLS